MREALSRTQQVGAGVELSNAHQGMDRDLVLAALVLVRVVDDFTSYYGVICCRRGFFLLLAIVLEAINFRLEDPHGLA